MSAILARQYEPQQMQPALPPQVQSAKAPTISSSRFWPTSGYEGWEYSVDWLVKDYIPSKSFGVVYEQSGSYKSFQVLDWACSIAFGIDWMGRKVKSGLVYYIAAEGAVAFHKRVKGWCDVHLEGEDIRSEVTDATLLEAVFGDAVLLVPMSVARSHSRRDFVVVPVTDAPTTGIALAFRPEADGELLQEFIGIVRGRTVNSSRSTAQPKAAPRRQNTPRRAGAGRRPSPGRGRR